MKQIICRYQTGGLIIIMFNKRKESVIECLRLLKSLAILKMFVLIDQDRSQERYHSLEIFLV